MSRGAEGTTEASGRRDQAGLAARKRRVGAVRGAVPAQNEPKSDRPRAKTPINRRKSRLRRRAAPLIEAEAQQSARQVSCHQDIASDGCFSLGMIAEYEAPIEQNGPWFYPRLFWEAGMIGQVLYLEAEAAGIRSTGIGCYFDDPCIVSLASKTSPTKTSTISRWVGPSRTPGSPLSRPMRMSNSAGLSSAIG